jgi:hypothetical protein
VGLHLAQGRFEFVIPRRGLRLAGRQRPQHGAATDSEGIARPLPQLNIATLKPRLEPIGHGALVAEDTLPIAGQFPEITARPRGNETGFEEPMAQQVCHPK